MIIIIKIIITTTKIIRLDAAWLEPVLPIEVIVIDVDIYYYCYYYCNNQCHHPLKQQHDHNNNNKELFQRPIMADRNWFCFIQ